MDITIQNLPFFCLIWIGIGFLFIMVGIFMIAMQGDLNQYTELPNQHLAHDYNNDIKELFSFFLQEEEKKNETFREILRQNASTSQEVTPEKNQSIKQDYSHSNLIAQHKDVSNFENASPFNEIIRLHQQGHSVEDIAKKLKKGVGEVNLMISLYTMK